MMGTIAILLLLLYTIQTSAGTAISAPTKVNNEQTVDGPLRISSYMAPLAGDPSLMLLGAGLFEKDLVELLASTLNFTFEPHRPPDVVAAGVEVNGTWNGCMGELVRQEIDLCTSISQTFQVPDKNEVVDFSVPIMFDYFGMLMPAPSERSKAYIVIECFSGEVWACLLVSCILVAIVLWLSYFTNPETRSLALPLSSWILFVVASLSIGERGCVVFNRGGDNRFSSVYRQMALFWCLPAVVLSTGYRALLFSLMSFPQYDYLIGGIHDLPQRPNEVNVHVLKGTSIDNYFISQTEGPFKWVTDQLRQNPEQRLKQSELNRVFDIVKGNNVLIGAGIAICLSLSQIDREVNKPPLLYRSLQSPFFTRGRTMLVQKGGPLKPMLDKQILLMLQHGLVDYFSRRRLPVAPPTYLQHEMKVLSLWDLLGAFVIYGIFLGVSLIAFIIEILWYRSHLSLERRKSRKLERKCSSLSVISTDSNFDNVPSSI